MDDKREQSCPSISSHSEKPELLHNYLSYPLSAAVASTKARGASGHLLEMSQPEVPVPPQVVTQTAPAGS